ncbi:hypothetical protein SAY87_015530 [Trapa incisa]|uniref:Uncharacterized protein n=1 Tax=Trapa incisa TaxID=236973 RepID=A0AAN7JL10_9MYRT|nr:hypothetical protein SAY87_015530 [Trapa incisa]
MRTGRECLRRRWRIRLCRRGNASSSAKELLLEDLCWRSDDGLSFIQPACLSKASSLFPQLFLDSIQGSNGDSQKGEERKMVNLTGTVAHTIHHQASMHL